MLIEDREMLCKKRESMSGAILHFVDGKENILNRKKIKKNIIMKALVKKDTDSFHSLIRKNTEREKTEPL